MKTKAAGILIFLTGVVGAIICGGSYCAFIHFPSIGYLLLVAGGLALIRYKTVKNQTNFFVCLKRYVIVAGVLGFLTGFVQMAVHFRGMETFTPAAMWGGFSIAVLTIFYALILYCILDAVTE